MVNHKNKQKQRLTLEIEGPEITAEKFAQGINSFLDLIKNVAKEISGELKGIRWLVDVQPGSAIVDFLPQPVKTPANTIPVILDAIVDGIVQLESIHTRPPHFSDKALRNAHDLASILGGKDTVLDRVRIWQNGQPNQISTELIAHVDSIFAIQSKDWGTIEGRLSVISERRRLHVVIYDPLTNKPTRCYFDEDILEEVTKAFGQRVSVFGLIRYYSSGEPVSIKVKEFSVFPKPEYLPGIKDVLGILGESD